MNWRERAASPWRDKARAAWERAALEAGGFARVGRLCGISRQAVGQWDIVPPQHVLTVERACDGRVSKFELRPDLYIRPKQTTKRPPSHDQARLAQAG
ncbi:MAG TPA: YdaS family helix-turn-helix protein [bacterium]|nr:YdaS family helix-turn-helix protein [bacterium]